MKKNSTSLRNSGTYTSPGTPEYGDNHMGGIQKGWQSERVPLQANSSRRHISVAALMPFNSGRALPSKWDDAERWITSPVSGFGVCKISPVQPQRQPKSKSGPLGTPEAVYFSNASPAVPALDRGSGSNFMSKSGPLGTPEAVYFSNGSPAVPALDRGSGSNFMVGSPLITGVLVADNLPVHYGGGIDLQSKSVEAENSMAPTSNVPGWLDLLSEASLPSSQDEKLDCTKDPKTMVSTAVSQRDVATQMSPEGSTHSSPEVKSLFSTSPPLLYPAVKPHGNHSAKVEVRDVQVDKGATVTCQSKKHGLRMTKIQSPNVTDLTSSWDIAEAAENTSKLQREEAKITAWENLQKAKAETAIRKLEVKLEKKRSASMDKILNKLRAAQTKAQDMRSLMSESHANHVRRSSSKIVFFRKFIKMDGIVRSCFTCRPF
ncbi:unnamed protein product [Ilex paraguariensis]|uniref:Remorin C-terminal domain-containing protein n=1 Tax=Ilex paraguariensis TaxID=185542 RepID=A0ABC8TAQ5_9AQUA